MKPFKYVQPGSMQEAVALLKDHQGRARLIAGGTDLLGALKDRVPPTYPEILVNLKTVPGLVDIRDQAKALEIGALVKVNEIAVSEVVRRDFPALALAARSVGSPQIRNMGTLGGNLCQDVRCWYYRASPWAGNPFHCLRKGGHTCYAAAGDNRYHSIFGGKKGCLAVHPSDLAVALVAYDAEVKTTERVLAAGDLFDGFKGTILGPHEILTGVTIPRPPAGTRSAFLKFRLRKALDFAIVSVAAVLTIQDGSCPDPRIVLGGVAPVPLRAGAAEDAIKGSPLDASGVERAAVAAVAKSKALSQNGYKIQIAKTLVQRVLLEG